MCISFESLESRSFLSAVGSIRGGVFADFNLNQKNDAQDVPADRFGTVFIDQSTTLYLDANNNGQFDPGERKTHPQNFHYHFNNLTPGTYHLREILRTGLTSPRPQGYTIHVDAGETAIRWLPVDPAAILTGTFFLDSNKDGIRQPGEQSIDITKAVLNDVKLPSVYVDFDNIGVSPSYHHRPGFDDKYHIVAIPPGTYHVRVPRGAYHYTTPIDVLLTFNPAQTITQDFGIRAPLPAGL